MALQLLRATTALRNTYTPASGEPVWDTDLDSLWIGDGATIGGIAVDTDAAVGSWSAVTTVNTGGAIEADVNAEDWTGHPNADTGTTSALFMDEQSVVYFGNDTNTAYLWGGPKGVTVGLGGSYVATSADFVITGQLNFDDSQAVTTQADMLLLSVKQGDVVVVTDDDESFKFKGGTNVIGNWLKIAVTDSSAADTIYPVADETAMLALANVVQGDIAIRADLNQTFKNKAGANAAMTDWQLIGHTTQPTGSSPIVTTSVNNTTNLIAAPYTQGDERVLTVTDGVNEAGTYKAVATEPTTGVITDWMVVSTDDYGQLA